MFIDCQDSNRIYYIHIYDSLSSFLSLWVLSFSTYIYVYIFVNDEIVGLVEVQKLQILLVLHAVGIGRKVMFSYFIFQSESCMGDRYVIW